MKTIITIVALLAAVSLAAQSPDQEQSDLIESRRVAHRAFPTLRDLAEKLPLVIGLTKEEARSARLEDFALPIKFVSLEALRDYPGGDPRTLLQDIKTHHHLIFLDGAVRSSIVVQKRPEGWVATDFGQVELSRHVVAAIAVMHPVAAVRTVADGYCLVLVCLPAEFVTTCGNPSVLTPLTAIPHRSARESARACRTLYSKPLQGARPPRAPKREPQLKKKGQALSRTISSVKNRLGPAVFRTKTTIRASCIGALDKDRTLDVFLICEDMANQTGKNLPV